MRTVTTEIPLPPRHCKPNQYCHWRTRGRAAAQYRQEAFYCARQGHHAPFCGPVRLSVTFYMAPMRGDGRYRPRDCGNGISALKAAVDGIVDSGLIADDNHKRLTWGEVRFLCKKSEHRGRACVLLTFEEIS